jgi:hypothetical protein
LIVACLFVAGVQRATLPAADFTLEWTHSIEHTLWRERYAIDGDRIRLVEARVEGSGAGMEAGAGARFDGSGWTWTPATELPKLTLTLSPYTTDYRLCAGATCRPLHRWVDIDATATAVVDVEACSMPAR